MNQQDIGATLDLRLIRTTLMLLKERSVSRVAVRLSQSQPAVSAQLKRARQIFNDPLLVRHGQGMVPTARGEEVLHDLERAMSSLLKAVSGQAEFDPATSSKVFRISMLSCFAEYLIPQISRQIVTQAPRAGIDFSSPQSVEQISRDLGAGDLDLVIGNWPEPPAHLRYSKLCSFPFGCVLAADHPLASGPLRLSDWIAARHVAPDTSRESAMGPVKGRLTQMGLKREVCIRLTDYQHIPPILSGTELIFTTVLPYALDLARRSGGALVARAAPAEMERISLYMLWHERAQANGEHIWLRGALRAANAQMLRYFSSALPGFGSI
ncbi:MULTISPECIES: LysR family transcriptional regulator [unclassified Haematobacter]|uniref:LysR family transcriptional regulator n=1 Tax=unclassified Haematobacter TaxID=2640585 RepID=UPI0025C2D2FC|nr:MULTISPECIES: LysR family transcriptional regulator [unclassified Haematobacter]